MARSKIGDIIEIPTRRGFAYAHHTHRHPTHGSLLRVFAGFSAERPSDIDSLAGLPVQFSTFFPLNTALTRKVVGAAGHAPVHRRLTDFPVFRSGTVNPATGSVDVWWLWDGEKEWRVGPLTQDQKEFPMREVINDTLMVERIEACWNPAVDNI